MRARRHTDPGFFAGPNGRRLLRDVGIIAATALIGWFATALWVSPAPLLSRGDLVVPRVLDLPIDEARTMLTEQGFRVRVSGGRTHPSLPYGAIVWQDPPPGTVLEAGRPVQLVTSAGSPAVPVPDVIGLELAQARRIVQAAGLKVGDVDSVISTTSDPSVVLSTRPRAGGGRPWGGTVTLVISRRPPPRPSLHPPPLRGQHDTLLERGIFGGTTR